jgi:hypothetical protein
MPLYGCLKVSLQVFTEMLKFIFITRQDLNDTCTFVDGYIASINANDALTSCDSSKLSQ